MRLYLIVFLKLSILFSMGCRDDDLLDDLNAENADTLIDLSDYPDWSEQTHGSNVAPDYNVVFNQTEVLRIDIEISSENWSAMQSDLASNMSQSGKGPGAGMNSGYTPMWVECSVKFNGLEWYHVGIRYKGNSSLHSTYRSGINKLSLKLDFDEFEDDYPAVNNQRFFGFRQLNLNNNFEDLSLMREKVGGDVFRKFGLVSAHTAFCVVYINNGSSTQYFGVYALVEEVDDTVIETQFIQNTGNLYKPDGDAASFASGTYNTSEFELKSNEENANYSDVSELYEVINSSDRTSDPEIWKNKLEAVFNVNVFLKWLAVNTVIQNWDTYGIMTHNYYLYNNPEDGLLTWIPWDNNEAFKSGKMGGALSLSLNEVSSYWPLISYLIAREDYKEVYKGYLQQFISEIFIPSEMEATYALYYEMLREYAYAEEAGYTFIKYDSEFDQAVETLKEHVQSRNNEVKNFLK